MAKFYKPKDFKVTFIDSNSNFEYDVDDFVREVNERHYEAVKAEVEFAVNSMFEDSNDFWVWFNKFANEQRERFRNQYQEEFFNTIGKVTASSPVDKKKAALKALIEHPNTGEHERENAKKRLEEMEEKYG
jgi:hypothetical protein